MNIFTLVVQESTESDVYRRQILTTKVGPRDVRVNKVFIIITAIRVVSGVVEKGVVYCAPRVD